MNQLRFRTRLVLILSLFAIVPALVLTQAEDLPRPKPNRENRLSDNGGRNPLEAAAIDRKLGFKDGVLMIENGSTPCGDGSKGARGSCGRHIAEPDEPLAHPLYPEGRVRIEHDVLGALIPEQREHLIAKLSTKLHLEPIATPVLLKEGGCRHPDR